MKTPAILLAATLSVLQSNTTAGGTAGATALENRVLRLEIGKAPAPFVERLVHKASGQALVAAPASKSLFSITLANEDGSLVTVDSTTAGTSGAAVTTTGATSKAVIKYGGFPAPGLAVEVTARCDEQDPLTLWTIRIGHGTGRRVKTVRFPQLLAVPSVGRSADDCLVLPALAGTLIENPAKSWSNGFGVTLRYPGNLSAQFLAYQDRSAGVYMAGRDTAGHPMALGVSKRAQGFLCWHEFTVVSDDGSEQDGTWESPYPVAVGVTRGRWCDTADQYKQWATRQPWCAKTLAQRRDVPAWWKDGPDVHVCEVRTYDRTRTCSGSYYPKLRQHLLAWRGKIDGPVVAMLAGWENHRRWTGGDCFPVFDEDRSRQVIGQLRKDGFRPFFFLSGMYYTYWNEGRDGGEIPAAGQHLASYVIDEKTGKPKEYVLNESNPAGQWRRQRRPEQSEQPVERTVSRDESRCRAHAGRRGLVLAAEHVRCPPGPDRDDPQPLPPVEDAGKGLPHAWQDAAPLRAGGAASSRRPIRPPGRQVAQGRRAHAGHPYQLLAVARRQGRPPVCKHRRNVPAAESGPRHPQRACRGVVRRSGLAIHGRRHVPAAVA